jgi:hypothetical protein
LPGVDLLPAEQGDVAHFGDAGGQRLSDTSSHRCFRLLDIANAAEFGIV